jgi:hypothetical protein
MYAGILIEKCERGVGKTKRFSDIKSAIFSEMLFRFKLVESASNITCNSRCLILQASPDKLNPIVQF